MSKKIIIIAIILVIIGGVLLFLSSGRQSLTFKPQQPTVVNQEIPVVNQLIVNNQPTTNQEKELTEEEKLTLLKQSLKIKVRNFVERYGSFSTDAHFQNLKDLKNEMSSRLWQETENYILQKEKEEIKEFYGVTTKVLSVEEISFKENEAEYLVSCQKEEIKGNQLPKVFYQSLELKMIKENGEWRVDQIQWK